MTEMLKGTLEGLVLAILAVRSAYGYEITARLREQGFSDIAEGTVYACSSGSSRNTWSTWRRSLPKRDRHARSTRSTQRVSSTSTSSGRAGASSPHSSRSFTKETSSHGSKVDRAGHRLA